MISNKIRQRNRINVLLHLGKLKGYRDKEDWSQGPILVYKNIMLIIDVIIILIYFFKSWRARGRGSEESSRQARPQ